MGEYRFGDHVSLMYTNEQELWQKVLPFLREGLQQNQRIVYVTDETSEAELKAAMFQFDQELFGEAFKRGAVVVYSSKDTYYKTGEFDPEGMYVLLAKMEQEALSGGYEGVRGCGEMTWMFRDVPGSEKLVEYEENLKAFLFGRKLCVMCLYNRDKFGPEMINLMLRIHPEQSQKMASK